MNLYPPYTYIANRYEVVGRPQIGGMGIVYLCFDHKERRPVALKTFKPEYLSDRIARERFLEEGNIWVALGKHPNIVQAYEIEYLKGGSELFLVLEQITPAPEMPNSNLRAWLTNKPLRMEQAVLFAWQIACGLQHAQSIRPNFVHRDLKPENVLVGADRLQWAGADYRVRVTDFGLAHEIKEIPSGEFGGGTPEYMAPEQWANLPLQPQTDMYALGCIFYEMISGRMAVKGNSIQALKQGHCSEKVAPLPTSVPSVVSVFIQRCLQKESHARYPSWREVIATLGAIYRELAGVEVNQDMSDAQVSLAEHLAVGWNYTALGTAYLDIGKPDTALEFFRQAHTLSITTGERDLEAASLGNLGNYYRIIGEAIQATAYYEQQLTLAQAMGDRERSASAIGNLGSVQLDLGNIRQAETLNHQLLSIARELGNKRIEAEAIAYQGTIYSALSESQRARECFEQVLIMSQEMGNRHQEATALANLATTCAALGQVRQSMVLHEKALQISRELGEPDREATALSSIGNTYAALGDTRRAISFHEQALKLRREIHDKRGEGLSLGSLASGYDDLNMPRQAVEIYEQALQLFRQLKARASEIKVLNGLGLCYKELNDWQKAIEYYQESLAGARQLGYPLEEGTALVNLSAAFAALGDSARALEYGELGLEIARKIGGNGLEATALANLANFYGDQGDFGQALAYYERALDIAREIGDRRMEMSVWGNLGQTYEENGDTQQAIKSQERSLILARELGYRQNECNALMNLGQAYSNSKDFDRAIECYEHGWVIAHEREDSDGMATAYFNMARLHAFQGNLRLALQLTQEAARLWTETGSPYQARAQEFAVQIQLTEPVSIPNLFQQAFEDFRRTTSIDEVQQAVARYPFMTTARFIQEIELVIRFKASPEQKASLQQQLEWIKRVARNESI